MSNIQTKILSEKGITRITSVVIINASKEQVLDVIKNIGDLHKFHPLVKNSNVISEKSSGIGAKRYCDLKPMDSMPELVTAWIEGNS